MNYPHDLGQIIQSRRQAEVAQAGNRQCTGTVVSCHGPKLIEPLKVLAIQIISSLSEQSLMSLWLSQTYEKILCQPSLSLILDIILI